MFTEDQKALMKSAKENLMQFGGRDGQVAIVDVQEAIKAAQETENRQMEGQTSLQKGDVFTVPADEAEFNDCLIARKFNKNQNGLSIGLLLIVNRGGKEVAVQVFSSVFTRGQRLIGADGKPEETMSYPKGQPAKDVRDTAGNMYTALGALKGKTIKVVDVPSPECWTLKRNLDHQAPFTEADYEVRKQRMITFAYEG